jgi:hypothetical protein
MTNDMRSRVAGRFLTATDRTAARDLGKVIQDGLNGRGLKQVQRAWDDLVKDVAEAQRQYNAAGGALPTADVKKIVRNFIVEALHNLADQAEGWAEGIGRDAKTAATKHPSASEMVRAATNKADAASVTLQEALTHLDTGYDEQGWDEKKHKDFQRGLDYAYKAIQKAKTEALKARRAIDNMRANV